MNKYYSYILIILIAACSNDQTSKNSIKNNSDTTAINVTSLIILGTIQDGGSPHIGCSKKCCSQLFDYPDKNRKVVSLGLYDSENNKRYLFEATPDLPQQMKMLKNHGLSSHQDMANGIFLTHAHIGHYTGLMYLGKEAKNSKDVTVYAMPKMKGFLEQNGPWSQLVTNQNIRLKQLEHEQAVLLSNNLKVTPILVPHRDEYSETVGYVIKGPKKSALFIPDIDKWSKWDRNIIEEIKKVDYAFIDATFYSGKEINNRDISEIPHPFIIESMNQFKKLDHNEKQKVIFIHFNHTNPVINSDSKEAKEVLKNEFRIGEIGEVFEL